ncbi:capping complex subunit for YIEGIA [Caldalkalibacillus salinus]|uniref:capping complex subunit for YIEGIA n=1 Tax=Caldalkalibacillus salinus TaxID=2803787 RepID=UPI00301A2BDF
METLSVKSILAVVTSSPQKVSGGGAPIFVVKDKEEIQQRIFLLENILNGMAHELDEETYILVRH